MKLEELRTSSDKSDILAKLEQYGVAVIENFISNEKLQGLINEYQSCMSGDSLNLPGKEYSAGTLYVIENNHEYKKALPETLKFFNSDFMLNISESYFKTKQFLLNHEVYICKDVKESDHESQILHYDRLPTLKFFIYLNDVTKKNGAFHCVPGSHKTTREKERSNRQNHKRPTWEETRANTEQNVLNEVAIEGKAGTLIIVHTDVVHRAGKLEYGERNLMRGHTRTFSEMPNDWTGKKVESFSHKFIKLIQKTFSSKSA